MTSLLTSDIHLTASPRDAYRFVLLDWIAERVVERGIHNVIILGDIHDAKDRYPASLVNRTIDGIAKIVQAGANVYFTMGNHDYIDDACPYYRFLNLIPKIHFVTEPRGVGLRISNKIAKCLFLPHTTNPDESWREIAKFFGEYEFIFCHQTFASAKMDNGYTETGGVSTAWFADTKARVFSGDIHTPQELTKQITYIGAPYRQDFGDRYTPRVILIDERGSRRDLHFPCPSKYLLEVAPDGEMTIDGTNREEMWEQIYEGDQVKARINLRRADLPMWPKLKKEIQDMAKAKGWDLFGPILKLDEEDRLQPKTPISSTRRSPSQVVRAFADKKGAAPELAQAGVDIVESVS